MKYRYILLLIIVLIFSGCYKDLGDYNYKQLPNPMISGMKDPDDSYTAIVGGSFEIKPTINYEDSSKEIKNYKYKWLIDNKLYSEEKDLKIDVVSFQPGKTLYCAYVVIDSDSGAEKVRRFTLKTESQFQNGWLILAKNQDQAELHYKKLGGEFYSNIYYQINKENLKGNPVKLKEHFLPWSSEVGQILVICNGQGGESVEVDGVSFKKVINTSQEFNSGVFPINCNLVNGFSVNGFDILMSEDGALYMRVLDDPNESGWDVKYQTGRYSDIPFYGNYKLSNWAMRGDIIFSNDIISYDLLNKCYVNIAAKRINSFNTSYDTLNAFETEKMNKIVITGGCVATESPYDYFCTFLRGEDSKYYVQNFYMRGWGSPKIFFSVSEFVFPNPELINSETKYAFTKGRSYMYFTNKSKLYRYNFNDNTPAVLVKEFNKDIDAMYLTPDSFNMALAIGNDFIIIDLDITNEGEVLSEDKGVIAGKAVDIIYKIGDQWDVY